MRQPGMVDWAAGGGMPSCAYWRVFCSNRWTDRLLGIITPKTLSWIQIYTYRVLYSKSRCHTPNLKSNIRLRWKFIPSSSCSGNPRKLWLLSDPDQCLGQTGLITIICTEDHLSSTMTYEINPAVNLCKGRVSALLTHQWEDKNVLANQKDAVGSRIDDIFLSKGMQSCNLARAIYHSLIAMGTVIIILSWQRSTFTISDGHSTSTFATPRNARFKTPMKAEELKSYKAALEAETGPETAAIQSQLSTLVHEAPLKMIDAKLRGHNPITQL